MGTNDGSLSGDPAVAAQLVKDFFDNYRHWTEQVSHIVDKSIEINKQVSSFHERLLLLSFGTIGISVSALLTLASKFASNPSAKHVFTYYVAPSWVLLLLSAMMCRNVMVSTIEANRRMVEDVTRKILSYNLTQVRRSLLQMSKAFSGTMTVDSVTKDAATVFAESVSKTDSHLEQIQKESESSQLSSVSKVSRWQSRLSVFFMQAALVLLAIAAIKFFLAT